MNASRICRSALVLAIAGLTVGITACSSGSSSTSTGTATASGNAGASSSASAAVTGAPEKPNITIGVLPSADSVTVQIAEDKGFFKQQGLNVTVVPEPTTNSGTQGLLSHTMDFTTENYVGMFAQEQAVKGLNLKIVADNSQTSPGLYVMLVSKDSPFKSLADLKGKKVGFPAKGFNFGSMAADILMAPYHMSTTDFTTVQVQPDLPCRTCAATVRFKVTVRNASDHAVRTKLTGTFGDRRIDLGTAAVGAKRFAGLQ